MAITKRQRELQKMLSEHGWHIIGRQRNGHLLAHHPESGVKAQVPYSPSDHRTITNCLARLKRLARHADANQRHPR